MRADPACAFGTNRGKTGQTDVPRFFLSLGGENGRTNRLSPGFQKNVKGISQGSVHPRSLVHPLDSRQKDYECEKGLRENHNAQT